MTAVLKRSPLSAVSHPPDGIHETTSHANRYRARAGRKRCVVIQSAARRFPAGLLRRRRSEKEYPDHQEAGARPGRRAQFVSACCDRPSRTAVRNLPASASSPRRRRACPCRDRRYRSRRRSVRENYDRGLCSRSSAETGRPVSPPEPQAEDARDAKAKTGCATGSKDRR
jgi:hypothetical protein